MRRLKHFKNGPLLREMATKPTVDCCLQTAMIIHIVAHTSAAGGYLAFASSIPIVNTARPIDSTDALLFMDDIQKLQINTSLVVLSACDSARGQLAGERRSKFNNQSYSHCRSSSKVFLSVWSAFQTRVPPFSCHSSTDF